MNDQGKNLSGRLIRGILVVLVGVIIWNLPVPAGVKPEAWHLLAIFVATIVGLVLSPLPMGAVVIIGVMMTTLTGVLKIGTALSGFANNTVWLVVAAFLIARGFITGLGRRISYMLIRAFGRKTLGLAYAISASDLILSPATPSNTARAGGIICAARGRPPGAGGARGAAARGTTAGAAAVEGPAMDQGRPTGRRSGGLTPRARDAREAHRLIRAGSRQRARSDHS